jgi:hypothetical protein
VFWADRVMELMFPNPQAASHVGLLDKGFGFIELHRGSCPRMKLSPAWPPKAA